MTAEQIYLGALKIKSRNVLKGRLRYRCWAAAAGGPVEIGFVRGISNTGNLEFVIALWHELCSQPPDGSLFFRGESGWVEVGSAEDLHFMFAHVPFFNQCPNTGIGSRS